MDKHVLIMETVSLLLEEFQMDTCATAIASIQDTTVKMVRYTYCFHNSTNYRNISNICLFFHRTIYNFTDPCTGQTCSNKGNCIVDAGDTSDGYRCNCNDFYTGNHCENGKFYI